MIRLLQALAILTLIGTAYAEPFTKQERKVLAKFIGIYHRTSVTKDIINGGIYYKLTSKTMTVFSGKGKLVSQSDYTAIYPTLGITQKTWSRQIINSNGKLKLIGSGYYPTSDTDYVPITNTYIGKWKINNGAMKLNGYYFQKSRDNKINIKNRVVELLKIIGNRSYIYYSYPESGSSGYWYETKIAN